MRPAAVLLAAPPPGRTVARFRMLSGAAEMALYGNGYAETVAWLGGAMVAGGGESLAEDEVSLLTVGDGDRLFASLYCSLFGDLVELRQRCSACALSFELVMPLGTLLPSVSPQQRDVEMEGGTKLRALTLGDLIAVADGADSDLLARTMVTCGSDDAAAVDTAFERLNPASIETIETDCANCGARQLIAFDLPRFFLKCAERERGVLLREVHLLARTYGWGLGDILSLGRAQRHELVRMATGTMAPQHRVRAA